MSYNKSKDSRKNILLIDCYPNQLNVPLSISLLKTYINKETEYYAKTLDLGIKLKNNFKIENNELTVPELEILVAKLQNKNNNLTEKEQKNIQIIEKNLQYIKVNEFTTIGFSSIGLDTLAYSILAARLIKNKYPNTKTIFGGLIFNDNYEIKYNKKLILNPEIDYLTQGQGYETLVYILNEINSKSNNIDLTNKIFYTKDNQIKEINPTKKTKIDDINIIPNFDDYSKNDYEEYIIPIRFIDGCGYNCAFCRDIKKVKYQELEKVIKTIQYLKNKYNPDSFVFYNNNLVPHKKYFFNLAKQLIEKKINIKYYITDNPKGYDEFTCKILKKTGCIWIGFGFENINEEILKLMNKPHTKNEALEALNNCQKYKINYSAFYISGFVNETKETFLETKEFIKNRNWNNNYNIDVFLFCIHPSSDIYKNPSKYNLTRVGVAKKHFHIPTEYFYETKDKTWEEIKKINYEQYKELKEIYTGKMFNKIVN